MYDGEGHLLTVGSTRSGKGVGAIIPNLLSYTDSVIVIDPKGENAKASADFRTSLGQKVIVLDPWNITGMNNGQYDPMSILSEESDSLIEDARLLADAVVVPASGRNQEFWEAEARSLITTLILHVISKYGTADQTTNRWLIFREIITRSKKTLEEILLATTKSDIIRHSSIAAGARRFLEKTESEKSGVLSTLRQQTDMFDSPSLLKSLALSSFHFAEAKSDGYSIFIVIPTWWMHIYDRWLRLIISARAVGILYIGTIAQIFIRLCCPPTGRITTAFNTSCPGQSLEANRL
jgi:type IV secretion system protein VirD4